MAPGLRVSGTALLAAFALAACATDVNTPEPANASTTASTAPSASEPSQSSTPALAPAETPPALPPEAQVADIYGGAAFIRHYFDVVNYAYRTGDVAAVVPFRKKECSACLTLEGVISTAYAAGNSITGGVIGVKEVTVTPGLMTGLVQARIVGNQTAAQIVDPTGRLVESIEPQADLLVEVYLEGTPDGWLLVELGTPT